MQDVIEGSDLLEHRVDALLLGNMGNVNDVHDAVLLLAALQNGMNAHVVLCEHARHRRKNARAICDREADVVLHLEVFDRLDRKLFSSQAAHDGVDALCRLDAAIDATSNVDDVAHYRTCGGMRTSAGTEEHGLADEVADNVNCIQDAVNLGHLMVNRNHGGMDADVDAVVGTMRDGQQLHGIAHLLCSLEVKRGDTGDTARIHIVHGNAGIERDRCEDGNLRGGIEAVNVSRRVRLGVTKLLGFLQRSLIAHAVLGHASEHVVGGAVHNAHDRLDLVCSKGVLQGAENRDATANACLEGQLGVGIQGSLGELFAISGQQRLVCRNDALAVSERLGDDAARNRGAANELDDDVDLRVVHDVVVVIGEQILNAQLDCLLGIQRAYAGQLKVEAVILLEVGGVVLHDANAAAANRTGSNQTNLYRHVRSLLKTMGLLSDVRTL